MSKAIQPDELERMKKEVDTTARQAARGKLGAMFPFEPASEGGSPETSITLPNKAQAKLRPHGDVDIDISATTPERQPIDMTGVTGQPSNADGSVTVDPRDVIDTLGQLGGVDLGKTAATTKFSTRASIVSSAVRTGH